MEIEFEPKPPIEWQPDEDFIRQFNEEKFEAEWDAHWEKENAE